MRIIVCGGRDYADREYLYGFLDQIRSQYGDFTVIHGAARGADTLGA